jgi:hypothetical protein
MWKNKDRNVRFQLRHLPADILQNQPGSIQNNVTPISLKIDKTGHLYSWETGDFYVVATEINSEMHPVISTYHYFILPEVFLRD